MATQNFQRNLLLVLYREGEKSLTRVACFLLPLKREITKSLMLAAYFLHLEIPSLPACYPVNTTLMAESKTKLKSLLMRVKEDSERADLTLNIKKRKEN